MIYILPTLLFFQGSSGQWPSGWAIIGWIVAAVVALVYVYSGVLQNLSTGRKDLLEVSDKKLQNLQKEKDQLQFMVDELEKQLEKMEKDKNDIEKDKTMLMREHHQLLEISVADLHTLKNNTKLIEQLEEEVNRLREDRGLAPRPKSTQITREG